MNYGRLWTLGNKWEGFRAERVCVGGGWVSPVMGIHESMDCMEHWVL